MSAICGIVELTDKPVTLEAIERLMDAVSVYGPNGSGIWREGSAALGHQMLHVTPESQTETLPWHDAESGLVITADAILDNRDELIDALNLKDALSSVKGAEGEEIPDSLLILQAYRKWGEGCAVRLLGDFAFAIWDARARKLFCARDHIGAKAFCYYYDGVRHLVFAPEIRPLLALPNLPLLFDETAIYLLLTNRQLPDCEMTCYRNIRHLPPAHTLTLSASGLTLKEYWRPEDAPNIRYQQEGAYVERLRELMQQAVRCRLRSVFPIGAHLSSGIDSSAVAVIAARQLHGTGRELAQTFSWSPSPEKVDFVSQDERHHILEICEREGLTCTYIPLATEEDHRTFWERDISLDPTSTLHKEVFIQQAAAQRQIRVLLSGWGGR